MNTWKTLFGRALALIDEIERAGTKNLYWTFGGGTVLMLRHAHRMSKDIDIFVPDPQALGYVTPRLSNLAESLTPEYAEGNGYVKLFFPEGEIDFVASSNLTEPCFEMQTLLGREVRVETSAEIIAKKFWHRGHMLTARDIFDYALVAEKEPENLALADAFIQRHAAQIEQQLQTNAAMLRKQFDAIAKLDYRPDFEQACEALRAGLAISKRRVSD